MNLSGFGIELNAITQDKIEKIRGWRNHPEIIAVSIDKQIISETQQLQWYQSLHTKKDRLYLLASYKGEDIGVVSVLSEGQTELAQSSILIPGLYIAPGCKYKNSVLAFCPSLVFIDYLFQQGRCNALHAQVFVSNESAIRYNKTLGYQAHGVDNQGLLTMTLNKADFYCAKKELSKILRF